MNSNLDRNNDPAQIKKQVIQDIKRVRDDIQEVKRALTPGQILDQMIFEHQTIGQSLEQLTHNPIGSSFLTIGALLLMKDEYNRTYESKLLNYAIVLQEQA